MSATADALVTLTSMQDRLAHRDVTVHKLRKLLGIEKYSEHLSQLLSAKKSPKKNPLRNKNKTNDDEAFTPVKPEIVIHPLVDIAKGDVCGECKTGKVYKMEPGCFLRITGHSPFTPEQHVMERFRCNTCGAYFTVPLPEQALNDSNSHQKYGYSARINVFDYFTTLQRESEHMKATPEKYLLKVKIQVLGKLCTIT